LLLLLLLLAARSVFNALLCILCADLHRLLHSLVLHALLFLLHALLRILLALLNRLQAYLLITSALVAILNTLLLRTALLVPGKHTGCYGTEGPDQKHDTSKT